MDDRTPEQFVRDLLWAEHPECCGCPVEDYGGEYMGQREVVLSCCGNPEPAMLNDAQIVASLRARFPDVRAAASIGKAGGGDGEVRNG